MTDAEMKVRTKAFGIRIVRLFRALPHSEDARIIGRQILRSGNVRRRELSCGVPITFP
jgi:hypothetical protein